MIFWGILEGLFLGFILTIFSVDEIIIDVLQPFFKIKLTDSHYYFVCMIIGIVINCLF